MTESKWSRAIKRKRRKKGKERERERVGDYHVSAQERVRERENGLDWWREGRRNGWFG